MKKNTSLFYRPKSIKSQNHKMKWVILPPLWRGLKYICFSLGAMLLISMVVWGFAASMLLERIYSPKELPSDMILVYKLDGDIPEGAESQGFSPFSAPEMTLQSMIAGLDHAATDPRVRAFIMSVQHSRLTFSQIEELRRAVENFRKVSDKPAYIYSLSYTDAGQGLALYSLASAFTEIWMAPLGSLSVNGIQLEQPYVKDLAARIGIEPQFFQREEYKSVFENITNAHMSAPTRESYQALVNSLVASFKTNIIKGRPDLGQEGALDRLIDVGYFLDTEVIDMNLADRVEYGDILLDQLRVQLGGDPEQETPEMIALSYYVSAQPAPPSKANQDTLAVIYVQGPIMIIGEGQKGKSIMGSPSESAEKIAAHIVNASEDKNVKALILRVDSPGGSPTASELIRRAVVRAQQAGKPVYVSMGSMAASGGYWISAPADFIFALPQTLTGSIGVAGGKISLQKMWDNIDVNWDHVGVGKNAGMNSMNAPYAAAARERINASMDRTYDMFLQIVAEGRHMSADDVRRIAKGRVWSGSQAFEQGLVDDIGDLNDTLDYAAMKAGHRDRRDMNVVTLPKPKTPLEEIMILLDQTTSLPPLMQQQSAVMDLFLGGPAQQKIMENIDVLQNSGGVMIYDSMGDLR